jgi:hypothetical protein
MGPTIVIEAGLFVWRRNRLGHVPGHPSPVSKKQSQSRTD